jgi:hypothetical protein
MNRWFIALRDVPLKGESAAVELRIVPGESHEGRDLAEVLMDEGYTLVIESSREVDLASLSQVVARGDSIVRHLGDDCVQLFKLEGC